MNYIKKYFLSTYCATVAQLVATVTYDPSATCVSVIVSLTFTLFAKLSNMSLCKFFFENVNKKHLPIFNRKSIDNNSFLSKKYFIIRIPYFIERLSSCPYNQLDKTFHAKSVITFYY